MLKTIIIIVSLFSLTIQASECQPIDYQSIALMIKEKAERSQRPQLEDIQALRPMFREYYECRANESEKPLYCENEHFVHDKNLKEWGEYLGVNRNRSNWIHYRFGCGGPSVDGAGQCNIVNLFPTNSN